MLYMHDNAVVIYLASPYVRSLRDLEQRSMYIADIPLHDVTRDLLWMDMMTRLFRKNSLKFFSLKNHGHLLSVTKYLHKVGCCLSFYQWVIYLRQKCAFVYFRYRSMLEGQGHNVGSRLSCPVPMYDSPLQSLDPNDPQVLRSQLDSTNAALVAERQQNQILHHALLPKTTAAQLQNGLHPQAGGHFYSNYLILYS